MKISKLYIRNFVTVMSIIIAAQICIAALFRITGPASREKNMLSELSCIAFLIRNSISDHSGISDKRKMQSFIENLSRSWSSDIWLEDQNGNTVASSTLSPRPSPSVKAEELTEFGPPDKPESPPHMSKVKELTKFSFHDKPKGPPPSYFFLKSDNAERIIYIKRREPHIFFEDSNFKIGLGIITIIVALILFPISKKITVPLKKLTESANAISRGELDIRVEENSQDEVGELARAFNVMSEKILQMINGTKELTANISHHIRSPLSRISVSVELIRDKIISGKKNEAEHMLSSIEAEIAEIVRLTENIIELIRVDVAHKSDEYKIISLTDIASETSNKYNDLMNQKSIIHSENYSKIPVNIYGVERDIYELFDILFDNAVRYSFEKGRVSLDISEETSEIKITLTNNSPLLTENMLNTIFDPFKRFAPEKIPGNGLGLAIAKRIVQNHGGSIHAGYMENMFSIEVIFRKVFLNNNLL